MDLYEYREDIRHALVVTGRSINLALSQRGRKALAAVGLEQKVLATAIPMRGRMLHDTKGNTRVVIYDPCTQQCLYSVGRRQLNEVLLDACDELPNITCHFNHKLATVNLREGSMEFRNPQPGGEAITTSADLIVGCDGAFSSVRQQLVRLPGFNYSQIYIETGYLELCIPAEAGDFQMPPNYLHIWPRDSFMMIALPNQDRSFTVTLSMPFDMFSKIQTKSQLLDFFRENFGDALPLIGEEQLVKDFFKTKPQHLVSIKCRPYHYEDKALILGDAAHAMVPYYGQGMNAGMEDVTLLTEILDRQLPLDEILAQFTEKRWQDAFAICDLAMYNYVEVGYPFESYFLNRKLIPDYFQMRDLTKRWSFRLRKFVDTVLFRFFPAWIPLYNSVSFSSMPYSECIANRKWQDQFLMRVSAASILAMIVTGGALYVQGRS